MVLNVLSFSLEDSKVGQKSAVFDVLQTSEVVFSEFCGLSCRVLA